MIKNTSILLHLQKNVIKHFGKEITTATDCDHLAVLLSQNFSVNISSQTLRRFFGLIKSDSNASNFTLNLLSNFCGYNDFVEFSQSYSNTELEIFFADSQNNSKDYWQKSEQLCQKISESPELLLNTHHRLMSFPLARKYFMENHPLRDMIGTVYSQYFLSYLKFNHNNQAKIFAYGFLFQSAFLNQNMELAELYFSKVKGAKLTEEVHVIPAGLKYGVQLLYADSIKDENLFKKYFAEMKKVRLNYIKASEKSVCSFEYSVLESLIFTNRTKEIRFLIENNTVQKENDQDFIPLKRKKTHQEVWNILCAAAYQKLGDKKNTSIYLEQVDLANLGIGWGKYYSIIYYFVLLKESPVSQQEKINIKLKSLISETNFSFFAGMLQGYSKITEEDFQLFNNEILNRY